MRTNETPLTDVCNRNRNSSTLANFVTPRSLALFTRSSLRHRGRRGQGASVTRLAPEGACSKAGRRLSQPGARRRSQLEPPSQASVSQARAPGHWSAPESYPKLAEARLRPATRMDEPSNEPGCLQPRGTRSSLEPDSAEQDELSPATLALFITYGDGAGRDGPTTYPQAAVARVVLVSRRADRCYCSALTASAKRTFTSKIGRAHV